MSQHIAEITDGRQRERERREKFLVLARSGGSTNLFFAHNKLFDPSVMLHVTLHSFHFDSLPRARFSCKCRRNSFGGWRRWGLCACICFRARSLQWGNDESRSYPEKQSHHPTAPVTLDKNGLGLSFHTDRRIERDTCCTKSIMMLERCWMLSHFVNSPALSHFISQRVRVERASDFQL